MDPSNASKSELESKLDMLNSIKDKKQKQKIFDAMIDSNNPSDKEFIRWLVEDVIPTIRKTGEYHFDDFDKRIAKDKKKYKQNLLELKKDVKENKQELFYSKQYIANLKKELKKAEKEYQILKKIEANLNDMSLTLDEMKNLIHGAENRQHGGSAVKTPMGSVSLRMFYPKLNETQFWNNNMYHQKYLKYKIKYLKLMLIQNIPTK